MANCLGDADSKGTRMSRKLFLVASTVVATMPLLAVAQTSPEMNGTLSFSTTVTNGDAQKSKQTAFNFVSDIVFSERFSLGLDVDYGRVNPSGTDAPNATLNRIQLEPTLSFGNGSYVGAYYQYASGAISIFSVGLESAGVFAGYDADKWAVEGYAGRTSMDLSFGGGDMSASNIGLTAFVRPTDSLEIFGHAAQANLRDDAGKIKIFAMGAQYDFDSGLMGYVAAETVDFGDIFGGTGSQVAFGFGYDLAKWTPNMRGTVTFEVARNHFEGGMNNNAVTIGWLIPIGGAKSTPLSSVARTARGGTRAPFVAGVGSLGLLGTLNPS